MMLGQKDIILLYNKRAKHYDISANLYHLLGFREQIYRKWAVDKLKLNKGDVVVDIGCGTGLNFTLLHNAIGPEGKIIGVDLTDGMLAQAAQRIQANGWNNVQLVQSDAAKYNFPKGINGIISSFAITLVPDYDAVICKGATSLTENGRFIILDLKQPERMPLALVRLGVWLTKPFGVNLDLAGRHPWESMTRYFSLVSMTELYAGFAYIACGEQPGGDLL